MGKYRLCVGAYAKNPFFLKKVGKKIYSIEELCYLIVLNAYMLDGDDFTISLVNFIDEELRLCELATELRSMLNKKCTAGAFAGTILEYVRYNSDEEIEEAEKKITSNSSMNIYEKRASRADYLMKSGSFLEAYSWYEELRSVVPDVDSALRARIEHNEGVIFANLFLYKEAAQRFYKEYEYNPSESVYLNYLSAMRLSMNEADYVRFIGENKQAYSYSMKLEKMMNDSMQSFASGKDNHSYRTLLVYKNEGKTAEYEQRLSLTVNKLKSEYRAIGAEN